MPKIGTHALGLDEDNAVDPNEGEQGEDEEENRGNQAGEFEVAAGAQDAGNSLHVDGVQIPEGRRTMLPGGSIHAQIRNTVNDIHEEENQPPAFRTALNPTGRIENQSMDFDREIDFDNNDIEENNNNQHNPHHNRIPSFQ